MPERSPARTQMQMERDRARVAELVAEGNSVPQAAEIINKSRPYEYTSAMARLDLDWIRAQWQAANIDSYDLHVSTQMIRYQKLQEELWEAWHRSVGKHITVAKRKSPNPNNTFTQTVETESPGDPSFLRALTAVLDSQNKLLGLYKGTPGLGDGNVTVRFVWGDEAGQNERTIGTFSTKEIEAEAEEDPERLLESGEDDGGDDQEPGEDDEMGLDPEPWNNV